jgi:hypothetical protein
LSAIVLSYFCGPAQPSLENHRHYARRYGYWHEVVDVWALHESAQLRMLYKYETLLHTLRKASPGQLVVLLTENAAVVDPMPLDAVMEGRDWLLVRTWAHDFPQTNVQVWRNTEAVRERIQRIAARCRLGNEEPPAEVELFGEFTTLHFHDVGCHAEVTPVLPCGYSMDPVWARTPTFAISIDGEPDYSGWRSVCSRFREVLVAHLNERRAAGLPLFVFADYDDVETAERSTYSPGNRIALVTLYTPNIRVFGRIAERNMRRYCERHGYTMYVHREIPAEVGLAGSGNWLKPWLLQGYLQHHEWVVWLDSDILIADPDRPLESLLEGRDCLFAHDIGQWPLNAGVIGLRQTLGNENLLASWMDEIVRLSDRSTVYAESGDQFYLIRALTANGLLDEELVSDFVACNTPWMFRCPGSFMVHYFGMWPQLRAMLMSHDNRLTH